jgi:ribosomal protein S18 acetylase RimI-like enzyme
LYFALFVPDGDPPLPRQAIQQPAISIYAANWGQPNDQGLLALDYNSGVDVGAAWLRIWSTADKGFAFIDDKTPELSIAVRPDYRGQGIGTRLLRQLFLDADILYDSVSLSVMKINPAINLYKRLGFEGISSSGNSLIMRRNNLHI